MTDQYTHSGNNRPPARLLDVIKGRSSNALQAWLNERNPDFRDHITIIAMDGFQGYATAAHEATPTAIKVMDLFHVVRLAGDKLTKCHQRLQREIYGRRGRKNDPLYKNSKTLLTRESLLTKPQLSRIENLFVYDNTYQPLEKTYDFYQEIIDCYDDSNKRRAKKTMATIMNRLTKITSKKYAELAQLGRSLNKHRKDILAFFDIGASNEPVEAINARLEHLRGIALSFRNLTHYILRCLIHSGNLITKINVL